MMGDVELGSGYDAQTLLRACYDLLQSCHSSGYVLDPDRVNVNVMPQNQEPFVIDGDVLREDIADFLGISHYADPLPLPANENRYDG